ncbi:MULTISPECIES: nucleotidyltransferase family protein [Methylobacterium]|jgi:molybdenum cofactor cytidylyltransferase|uniref:nucleotidyltransferase family protein n=1 Tax=Methylobacterium TaxID=407 RepID=UPI0008F14F1A|nr:MULTISPECIES: nucleotidyltransferase family protein [Methylobacterium]MBZ6413498.1 nucleotidyltransferase family protein [Methylobacterium sp.]MBK3398399.1 nucleotidyltransferase family protein [Methylobacterium ajmalii]MBK3409019.1 nucleotidyltransferase family protein [Methylobacterium ajmalii]MBK3420806.1 nucleotidyltransferase family protein [Methylobacterium ajmalii]SFF50341.1 molybdenum cofactor cytidylyltransferase [Methylobacterium sp. yr596]
MRDPVGTVLLAAGRGTRFGASPKLLSVLDGKPLVRHAAEAAVQAGLGPVVAVLGHAGAQVREALAGLPLTIVDNPDYAAGLSTSLRAGLAALPEAVTGAIVLLGDMPRVGSGLPVRLAEAFRAAPVAPAAVVPVKDGRRGNPVLLNRRLLSAGIAGLTGDRGAGPLLARRDDVLELAVDEAGVLIDVDTPAALAGLV